MRAACLMAIIASLIPPAAVAAQQPSQEEMARTIAEIQARYIRENVPDQQDFGHFLARDLQAYFERKGFSNPTVKFELLRNGPTQIGVSYPVFYLWVRLESERGRPTSGAVRVEAIDRKRFGVTHFLTDRAIKKDPSQVRSIFPAALAPAIFERAAVPKK
jgi:hypothetical protein